MSKIYFSRRKEIAEEAIAYLASTKADTHNPENIVAALSHLGYLQDKKKDEGAADDQS